MSKLQEEDWLFTEDLVPDDELIVCLLWEYLRESQTVRELALDWFAWSEKGQTDSSDQEQTALWGRMKNVIVKLNSPLQYDDFICRVLVQGFGLRKLLDCPWQQLDPTARKSIINNCAANPAAFIGYDFPHLKALNNTIDTKRNKGPVNLAKAMLGDLHPGQELMLVVVDWRYDESAIKDGIKRLADDLHRPEGIELEFRKASGLGRASEWRGKLNDLGVARLSRYHARQLELVESRAYKFLITNLSHVDPTAVEKKMSSSRRRFKASFRKILPFERRVPHCLSIPRFTR